MTLQEKALEILNRLYIDHPHPTVELDYTSPFELLVATILSAQTTDKLVNKVTPALFRTFPTIADYADATPEEIDHFIKKINFHNTKAKNISGCATLIMQTFKGEVPHAMEALLQLPGVARKTANVVLGTAYGIATGIVIDTHGIRLANKLGLSMSKDPIKIERALMELIPQDKWIDFGQLLTLHGRYTCIARPHSCDGCVLGDLCPEYRE